MPNRRDQENEQKFVADRQSLEMLQAAVVFQKDGRLVEAQEMYSEILRINPENFDAIHMSAVIARNRNFYEVSEKFFIHAIHVKSDFAPLYVNYVLLLNNMKSYSKSLTMINKAIEINSDYIEAYFMRGHIFRNLSRFDEALESFRTVICLNPNHAAAMFAIGVCLHEMDRVDDALASYDRAIAVKFEHAEVHYNRGVVLRVLNNFIDALASYNVAITLNPSYASAYYSRGNVLKDLKRFDEALISYDMAISLNSDNHLAFFMRGIILQESRNFKESILNFNVAICMKPDYAEAYNFLGYIFTEIKQYDCALESYRRAVRIKNEYFIAHSNLLFSLSYNEEIDVANRLEEARSFGRSISRAAREKFSSWNTGATKDRLRIGFVSGDFWNHPVGYFLKNVVSNLDQSKLECIGYTNNHYEDNTTLQIKKNFSAYKSIVGINDYESAKLIHSDGVQILVDLSGHTALNRLPVFGYKPSPVQVSWLGYWATTGVAEIDYVLGDPIVTPLNEAHHFSERITRLPETYFCFSPPDYDISVTTLPALHNGYVTYGCFNNFSKINENVIALWARILTSVPGSKLYLKASQLDNSGIVQNAVNLFSEHGIAKNRLIFEGRSDRVDYLRSYNKVDITLDPFPYPGGTTSVESLWMGVPVLTKKGSFFIAHNGETIAHSSGQASWIAEDKEDYLRKAIHFSNELPYLSKLRNALRPQLLESPLLDSVKFARNFENKMYEIWESYSEKN